jgi:hypothetical protein
MMFMEAGDPGNPFGVWYAAVTPDCALHPYPWDLLVGIRGSPARRGVARRTTFAASWRG